MLYNELSFEKYNDFVNRENKISPEILNEDVIQNYENEFRELEERYKYNEPLNYEFIKLSQFYLVDIFNMCIYKTVIVKKNQNIDKFNEYHNNCYRIPIVIYKKIWEAVRNELEKLLIDTKNLKDLSKYSTTNGRYEDNRYKSKKLKRFDKLRYIYKYYLNYWDISYTVNYIRVALDFSKEVFLKHFIKSTTDTDLIDQETKRRFYNELNKYWINFANKVYEDALIYFIFEKKLKKINLRKKIFLYNKNIGIEK